MQTSTISPDFLTAELQARGLHFLAGQHPTPAVTRLEADKLLAGLAQQQDARLRSALIPLLLHQPHLVEAVPLALADLDTYSEMTLKVYFTAAVILQDEFTSDLQHLLPNWRPLADHYSHELGVDPDASIDVRLSQLGDFHTQLTGMAINWSGTYRHAAMRLVQRLKREARWRA